MLIFCFFLSSDEIWFQEKTRLGPYLKKPNKWVRNDGYSWIKSLNIPVNVNLLCGVCYSTYMKLFNPFRTGKSNLQQNLIYFSVIFKAATPDFYLFFFFSTFQSTERPKVNAFFPPLFCFCATNFPNQSDFSIASVCDSNSNILSLSW